jgi:hypothetical protein
MRSEPTLSRNEAFWSGPKAPFTPRRERASGKALTLGKWITGRTIAISCCRTFLGTFIEILNHSAHDISPRGQEFLI